MNTNKAIVVKDLTKSFKENKVLQRVGLEVAKGTILALLGPNGAGKTTIIRILSTLLEPDGGEAYVNGIDVIKEPQKVRECIGLTGQYAAVDEYLTGVENLLMMGRLYHLSAANARRRAKELLGQFDLLDAQNRKVRTYSGGMRRRLDLALSLIATPPILFLDEPTTGLDPRSRLMMWDMIEGLAAADVTILLTTQYMEEADRLADKIAVLDQGKIIAQGTSEELKSHVGRDRMKLVMKNAMGFSKAVQIFAKEGSQTDERRRLISIPVGDSISEVKDILDKIERADIRLESFSLDKPTMDDVFLNLTGHKAAAEEDKENV